MAKMRVYELSKELGIQSKDLIIILNEMGAGIKNHMSTVDEEYAVQVRKSFNTTGGEKKKKASVKTIPKPSNEVKKKTTVQKKPEARLSEKPEQKQKQAKTASDKQLVEKTKERKPEAPKPVTTVQRSREVGGSKGRTDVERKRSTTHGGGKTGSPMIKEKTRVPSQAAKTIEKRRGKQQVMNQTAVKQKQARTSTTKRDFVQKPRPSKHGRSRSKKPVPVQPTTNVKSVQIPQSITVKEFAQAIEVSVADVIKKLMSMGVMVSQNKEIDLDTATLVGDEFGVTVNIAPTEEETLQVEEIEDAPESLVSRSPVVTIMGHVDHGKTSLLDAIRETNVIASEAGGITQHIGAYQVDVDGKKVTFLDTPGHEAFTAMRARGTQVTDIAILVVAADDGVMPQTVEAINHGKAADIPIIVAINKTDKPETNPERVKQELTQYGLVPENWGGDTICVEVSALKKIGIDELLEMILLVAEMKELKANPNRPAKGAVIEVKLDKGRGPVATVLVQNGTLRVGDTIIVGEVSGRIRALVNDKGKNVKKAGPSEPVEIVGLDDLPEAGDTFYVIDEKYARQLAEKRQQFRREQELKKYQRVKLEDLFDRIKEGEMKELNIILKADVHGSVEAIQQSLEQLSSEEVRVKVIHGGVGAINESDIMLASASDAIVFGFNVRPDPIAKRVAERENVDLRMYRIIYNIIDDVKKAMAGMLEPEYEEVVLGRAEVRATFKVPKVGTVAGCYVNDGKVTRNAEVRVLRDNIVIFEGKIESLKRFKDDVKEVASGFECGIGIERFNDIKEGDVIEAFINQEIKQTGTTGSEG
jgi:translation initiation factor IF-2